jgi:NAD(P) transhydrogenase
MAVAAPGGAIAGRGGLLKLIFQKQSRTLLGVHCICDIASEIIGIGPMVIRCDDTLHTIANMSVAPLCGRKGIAQ